MIRCKKCEEERKEFLAVNKYFWHVFDKHFLSIPYVMLEALFAIPAILITGLTYWAIKDFRDHEVFLLITFFFSWYLMPYVFDLFLFLSLNLKLKMLAERIKISVERKEKKIKSP